MEIRKLTPDEYGATDLLESLSFVFPLSDDTENEEPKYHVDRWGCLDEKGVLNASLGNHDLPVYFDGGIAPARGVGGVASDPVSRGQGHIRALLKAVLEDDRENGQLFSVLYPFSHPFYRKFGYELCFDTYMKKFPMEALREFRGRTGFQVRMITPDDGTGALQPIYTAYAKQFNLAVARDARIWQRYTLSEPKKADEYCYVLSRGGEDIAYAMFKFRVDVPPFIRTLCLDDYAFKDIQALYDLLAYLYRYSAQAKHLELMVPPTLPLSSLLPEPNHIETARGIRPMARAVHVEKVLTAMRHPKADCAYSIYVEDEFLPDNTGNYRVGCIQGGSVTVLKTDAGEADLRVSVQTFTQLAFGFLNLEEAAMKPDVQVIGNQKVLEQVFVKKPIFLWDFY